MNKQAIYPWILFVVVLLIGIIGYFNHIESEKKLIENHIVACATITSVKPNRSGGGDLTCEVEYKGVTYKKRLPCLGKTKRKYSMGINKILVLLQEGNPSNLDILEMDSDFRKFNIRTRDTIGLNCSTIYF